MKKTIKMEHYYVITGNEFGSNLDSKQNFKELDDANINYNSRIHDDFYCTLIHVDGYNNESTIKESIKY